MFGLICGFQQITEIKQKQVIEVSQFANANELMEYLEICGRLSANGEIEYSQRIKIIKKKRNDFKENWHELLIAISVIYGGDKLMDDRYGSDRSYHNLLPEEDRAKRLNDFILFSKRYRIDGVIRNLKEGCKILGVDYDNPKTYISEEEKEKLIDRAEELFSILTEYAY